MRSRWVRLAGMLLAALFLGSIVRCAARQGAPRPGAEWRPFVEMARQAGCADLRNRLHLIDGELVLWDRAGNCPDNGYGQRLYRRTPGELLCSAGDSIAGPRQSCPVESYRELFERMIGHLDDPDLGLGPGHTVTPIPF